MSRNQGISRATAAAAAVPLATGALLLWHPPDPAHAMELAGLIGRWLTVHVGLLVALPLLALVVRRILSGVDLPTAKLARFLVVPAAVMYAAFDSLLGIGTGVLVDETNHIHGHLHEGAVALTQAWWTVPTTISLISVLAIGTWTLAVATAGVASMRGGLGRATGWSLIFSAVVFAAGHPGVTGGLAMAALAVAVVAADRARLRVGEVTGPESETERRGVA